MTEVVDPPSDDPDSEKPSRWRRALELVTQAALAGTALVGLYAAIRGLSG
ncbi:hypothetical protein GCM10009789_82920 [Kribbella sancticallisti]|uniref:Uncharacterized protein n=1 Tax=Kribbella sancticallisti TaxID=460087 RepID=A0ABN2EW76_9ACTN